MALWHDIQGHQDDLQVPVRATRRVHTPFEKVLFALDTLTRVRYKPRVGDTLVSGLISKLEERS